MSVCRQRITNVLIIPRIHRATGLYAKRNLRLLIHEDYLAILGNEDFQYFGIIRLRLKIRLVVLSSDVTSRSDPFSIDLRGIG